MKHALALIGLLLSAQPALATGRYTCETVADDKWLTQVELTAKLVAAGWKVNRMKKDGGCWEVYGTMPDGRRVEAYFHPASAEQLFVSQRGKIIFQKP